MPGSIGRACASRVGAAVIGIASETRSWDAMRDITMPVSRLNGVRLQRIGSRRGLPSMTAAANLWPWSHDYEHIMSKLISKSRFKAHALELFRQVEHTGQPIVITDR